MDALGYNLRRFHLNAIEGNGIPPKKGLFFKPTKTLASNKRWTWVQSLPIYLINSSKEKRYELSDNRAVFTLSIQV